jgi:hypothetical protein
MPLMFKLGAYGNILLNLCLEPCSFHLGSKIHLSSFSLHVTLWRSEGPKWRTREGESEWEPIKILFKNSAYEPDFTQAPPQASLAKPTQPLECY